MAPRNSSNAEYAAAPPLTVGACATLACAWEVTAAKPGNVYRGADFDDLTFADFLASAALIGPIIERTLSAGVGVTVQTAVTSTRAAVGTNTNLGMLLLITPLAAVPPHLPLAAGIEDVLKSLTVDDAEHVYAAIRHAQPGGLGRVEESDVNATDAPRITLRQAMALAADRDLIARQYVNGFVEVFQTADRIAVHLQDLPLGPSIIQAYLELLAERPDSLVARKCGPELAAKVSAGAAAVLDSRRHGPESFAAALADFDFWLRADGHRRNPGTSADIIAAGLFVLLRERRLRWPVRFY